MLLFNAPQFLELQAFVDQGNQRFSLKLRQIFVCRLDTGRCDQQAHPLGQVVGRDDVVVDDRRN